MTAYIGLGSNLDDPQHQIERAITNLGRIRGASEVVCSRLYRNPPIGPQDQPEFVNAVAALTCALPAANLLAELQAIERLQGRVRDGQRWGPRIIDLDLLLYGSQMIDRPGLCVPHCAIAERAFVLVPLAEIAPQLELPQFGPIADLLASIDCSDVVALAAVS